MQEARETAQWIKWFLGPKFTFAGTHLKYQLWKGLPDTRQAACKTSPLCLFAQTSGSFLSPLPTPPVDPTYHPYFRSHSISPFTNLQHQQVHPEITTAEQVNETYNMQPIQRGVPKEETEFKKQTSSDKDKPTSQDLELESPQTQKPRFQHMNTIMLRAVCLHQSPDILLQQALNIPSQLERSERHQVGRGMKGESSGRVGQNGSTLGTVWKPSAVKISWNL